VPGRSDLRRGRCPARAARLDSINAELSKLWKPIVERKPAPADAEEWAKVKEKKHLLER